MNASRQSGGRGSPTGPGATTMMVRSKMQVVISAGHACGAVNVEENVGGSNKCAEDDGPKTVRVSYLQILPLHYCHLFLANSFHPHPFVRAGI